MSPVKFNFQKKNSIQIEFNMQKKNICAVSPVDAFGFANNAVVDPFLRTVLQVQTFKLIYFLN